MNPLEEAEREAALAEQELKRLDALIKPLKAERSRVEKDREKAYETIAQHATSDAELLAVAGTRRGHQRICEIAESLHPAIRDTCRWAPPEARNVGLHTPIKTQLGVQLALEYAPTDEYLDTLVDALCEFNRRFVPDYAPPTVDGYSGYADLLARRDGAYYHIEFTPDGARAVLVGHVGAGFAAKGTLREVLAEAASHAGYHNVPDEDEDDQ